VRYKPLAPGQQSPVLSPEARYLQVKIEWPFLSNAGLRSLDVAYRPHTQAHYVDAVMIEPAEQDGAESERTVQGKAKAPNPGPAPHKNERKIVWKVTNPDQDPLVFLLFFQPENSSAWVPVKTSEPITKTKFSWDTSFVPDGWYRVKVMAKDSPDNPPEEVLSAEAVSERFLIDNLPPAVKGLVVIGDRVSGRVEDELSAIAGIQFQIDAGEWMNVAASDGLLDGPRESFVFALPSNLEPGPHILTLRAWDRANNVATAKEQFHRRK
jgi:hypothetical protein